MTFRFIAPQGPVPSGCCHTLSSCRLHAGSNGRRARARRDAFVVEFAPSTQFKRARQPTHPRRWCRAHLLGNLVPADAGARHRAKTKRNPPHTDSNTTSRGRELLVAVHSGRMGWVATHYSDS